MYSNPVSVDSLTCLPRGLKYVSKDREERVRAIANALSAADYDVITLQELWVFSDYEHVRATVSKKLPYSKFFYRYACLLWGCSLGKRANRVFQWSSRFGASHILPVPYTRCHYAPILPEWITHRRYCG